MGANSSNSPVIGPKSPLRRYAPVIGLAALAPWVGEYLLGNVPANMLPAMPFLMPLYGGGAVLIRETARRTGRGWPTIICLGMAYGVIEAGLVDQSLFNPSFEGHAFQAVTPIPALGISAHFAIVFVMGHAIWSISVPIAIVELLTPSRQTTPWLGTAGIVVTAVFYLLGCWIIFQDLQNREEFIASPAHMIGAGLVAISLIAIALVPRRRFDRQIQGWAPSPWLLGIATFIWTNLWFVRPENWTGVALGVSMPAIAAMVVAALSRRRGWSARHEFALVAGALPTYMWAGFVLTALLRPDNAAAWIGNIAFALIAAALLLAAGWTVRQTSRKSDSVAAA